MSTPSDRSSLVIDNIGSLDHQRSRARTGPAGHRRERVGGDHRRRRRGGRSRRRGRRRAHRCRRAPACCPASSTRTPTSCSPATEPRSSPPAWPAGPTTAAGSGSRPRRPGTASTDELHRLVQRRLRRGPPGRHHDHRDQVGLRPERRRRGPVARDRRDLHRRVDLPRRPPRCRPSSRVGPTTTSTSSAARCSTARSATPDGSTRSARPAPSTPTSAGPCSTPAGPQGLGLRLHGNQLGHGPGVQLAVECGCASVDHCTYLSDDDIEALAAQRHGRHVPPGHRLLDPPALPRRPPGDRCRGHRRHRLELQSRVQLHHVDLVLHRPRGTRHAHDHRRGGPGRHHRWRARRCGGPTSAGSRRARPATPRSSTRRRHHHLAYRPGVAPHPPDHRTPRRAT